MENKQLTDYERNAVKEIHVWKAPGLGWFGYTMHAITWPIDKAGDTVMKIPGVGWVLQKTVAGLLALTNDLAQWSVRPEAIFAEYRARNLNVNRHEDIYELDLSEIDKTIGWLGAKYKGIALVEGATAGSAGLPGIPPDLVALVTLNLRAIGEYGTYCGFDMSLQSERLFALNVLALASSPTDASKTLAMAQLVRIARDVAVQKSWKELNQHAFVNIVRRIMEAVGPRLTKAKLLQLIPYTGAIVGGGFNTYYTNKVCDAAFYLYRERFLARKYGDDALIEVTVPPAEKLEPDYEIELIPPDDGPPPSGPIALPSLNEPPPDVPPSGDVP